MISNTSRVQCVKSSSCRDSRIVQQYMMVFDNKVEMSFKEETSQEQIYDLQEALLQMHNDFVTLKI